MKKITASTTLPLLECVNLIRNKWRVRVFVSEKDGQFEYSEQEFIYKPSFDTIQECVIGFYNQQTDQKILSGFTWKDYHVWLSTENQFNYKAEYDLAVQTAGATLPAKFKFGTTEAPQYHIFETMEELTDFYIKVVQYIRVCLDEGYAKKDAINWEEYQ